MADVPSESLNYDPVQNRAYLAALQGATRRRFYGMNQPSGPLPPHRPPARARMRTMHNIEQTAALAVSCLSSFLYSGCIAAYAWLMDATVARSRSRSSLLMEEPRLQGTRAGRWLSSYQP